MAHTAEKTVQEAHCDATYGDADENTLLRSIASHARAPSTERRAFARQVPFERRSRGSVVPLYIRDYSVEAEHGKCDRQYAECGQEIRLPPDTPKR
jgi:hypothetical protein